MRVARTRIQHDACGVLVKQGEKLGGSLLHGRPRNIAMLNGIGGILRAHREDKGQTARGRNRRGGDRAPVLVTIEQRRPAEHVGGCVDGATASAAWLVYKDVVSQSLVKRGGIRRASAQGEREEQPQKQGDACEKHARDAQGAGADRASAGSKGHMRFLPGRAGWGNVVLSKCLMPKKWRVVRWCGVSSAWYIVRGLSRCERQNHRPRRTHVRQGNPS